MGSSITNTPPLELIMPVLYLLIKHTHTTIASKPSQQLEGVNDPLSSYRYFYYNMRKTGAVLAETQIAIVGEVIVTIQDM